MSKLSQLRGDSQTIKIKDIEIEIKPMSFKEFTLAMELYDNKKNIDAMEYLIFTTLKKIIEKEDGVSSAEYEINLKKEIAEMPPKYAIEILTEIQKVNGLSGEGSEKKEK